MFSELKLPVILQGRQWFRRWSDSRGAPGRRGWILSSIHSACQSVLEQKPASVCVRDCETPACTLLLSFKAWWQHKLVCIPDVQSFLKVPYWAKLTKVFRTIASLQTVSEHFQNGGGGSHSLLACWPKKNVFSDMQCWRLNLDYVTRGSDTSDSHRCLFRPQRPQSHWLLWSIPNVWKVQQRTEKSKMSTDIV